MSRLTNPVMGRAAEQGDYQDEVTVNLASLDRAYAADSAELWCQ